MKASRLVSLFVAFLTLFALLFGTLAPAALAAPADRIDVLIGFKRLPGVNEESLVRAFGGSTHRSFRIVPAISASLPAAAINILRNHPLVSVVEIDGLFYAIDAELDNTWGVKRIGSGGAHDTSQVGSGVKVAVIDTGIDYTHSELSSNYAGGYDFVNKDNDPIDDNGHGTHVSGTVAAVKNSTGVVGVSPSASLFGLKVLAANGSGSFSNVIAALEWAMENGIQVTNNSYGSGSDPGTLVKAAFDKSAAAGILHIAAAGNSGNRRGKGNNVGYPARYDSVVAVAATDKSNNRASFSSTGPAVELSAPGVSIRSTVPGGGYADWNGTSMASPHVAGAAAVLIAADPAKSASEIRTILQNTALDLGASGRDNHFGFGLVQVLAALEALSSSPPVEEPAEEEPTADIVSVSSISYSDTGSRGRDLTVALAISNSAGEPVGGASISITLNHESGSSWNGSGNTNSSGNISFTLRRAPSGCYTTDVVSVSANGLTWDSLTPSNNHCR